MFPSDDPPRPTVSGAPIGDARDEFETPKTTRPPEAEKPFARKQLELIRSAPGLTDEERAAAISELQRLLEE